MNSDDWVKVFCICVVAAILIALVYSYNQKCVLRDNEAFAAASRKQQGPVPVDPNGYNGYPASVQPQISEFQNQAQPSHPASADVKPAAAPAVKHEVQPMSPGDCYPRDNLTAQDLLPQDANTKWAQVNPAGQGDIAGQNFLTAGYHTGINTVGSTLRNANLQLRSDPINPQLNVSPWNQTTIEPDFNHRALEIGSQF